MYEKIKAATDRFFQAAAQEEVFETRKENNTDTNDVTASGDGTWQTRGFASLYGVASLIGFYTGKVLDILVKSAHCQLCKIWENRLTTVEYEEWYEKHVEEGKCETNHSGPAGNMETAAVKEMFRRSEEKLGVRYRNYIGDGDSKTFTGIHGELSLIHI